MPDHAPPSPTAPPHAALLAAWLAQSHDLLALTDAAGVIRWCNAAFEQATGLRVADQFTSLAQPSDDDRVSRDTLTAALRECRITPDTELALRTVAGTALWVQARVAQIGTELLWTLRDTTANHALAARAQRLSELLETAQEFGRLGVWERNIPSGTGRWDRHVFGFWGMDPDSDTPDYPMAASRVHAGDRSSYYLDSTRRAGRYAERYRVIRPDGSIRWIHSQWKVKNSAQGQPERTIGIMVDDTEVYELARSRDDTAAQLKVATELADIVIWRHDLGTDRVHYNDHGFKVLGIAPAAGGLSLEEARSHTHPDDVAKLAASSAHALATGVPIDVEVRHRRDDGAWRDMLVRRVIERDHAGAVLAFVGVTLDVTARVEQSRRAEQLAGHLDAAAQAARIGIWTTVAGTRETEWNAQMYELFDLVDIDSPPTLGEWLARCVHPDDKTRVARVTRAFMQRETRAFEIEFRINMRDGRVRWMVLRADLDRSGVDPTRVFGIVMDVTERHDALDALHAAAERAALIARHAGIGTWETDERGGSALWDVQMWRLRGLASRPVPLEREERLALVHPEDRAHVLDAKPELANGPRSTAYEFRARMPDGSYRWLASRSAALRDEHGKVVRRVGVNWDITDAKNADLARQQALLAERESRAKSQFLSRMSHELRTPLNAVLGFTQLLQSETDHGDVVARSIKLDHIRCAGEHLLTLIDDALDLSSLQSGTLRLDLNAVPLAAAVAQALPLVEALAAVHGVTLHVGKLDGSVHADATRLRGGHVVASSEAGRGTVIEVTLAQAEQAAVSTTSTQQPQLPTAQVPPPSRAGQLLYIEDNGVNVVLVEELVKRLSGLRIVSEASGAAGVARARSLRPDLILIDLQLPDFDGFEVLRQLRAHPETATIPCIALSANAMPDDLERGLAAGFDDYWTKPIKFKPFLDALDRMFPPTAPAPLAERDPEIKTDPLAASRAA